MSDPFKRRQVIGNAVPREIQIWNLTSTDFTLATKTSAAML